MNPCGGPQLPADVRSTIDNSWIRYDDLVTTLKAKHKLDHNLKQVFFYIIFLIFFYVHATTFDNTSARFQYGQSLERVLFDQKFDKPNTQHGHQSISFANITEQDDFWQWFWNVLSPEVIINSDRTLLNSHLLLWGVRMRAVRLGAGVGCSIPDVISQKLSSNTQCFLEGEFTSCLSLGETDTDEESGCDDDNTTKPLLCGNWSRRDYHSSNGFPTRGFYETYPAGGYVQDFDFVRGQNTSQLVPRRCSGEDSEKNASLRVDHSLMPGYLTHFLDATHWNTSTSDGNHQNSEPHAVITEVYTYLGNLNLFGRARMIVEISSGGSYKPSMQVQSGVLLPEKTISNYIAISIAVVLALGSLYYIATLEGWRKFSELSGGLRFLFVCDVLTFMAVLTSNILMITNFFSDASVVISAMDGDMSQFPPEFGIKMDWLEIVNGVMVLAVLLATVRTLQFSSLLRATDMIMSSIVQAVSNMGAFLIIFCTIFVAIAFAAMSLFGRAEYGYSTVERAAMTQLSVLTGSFNYQRVGQFYPEISLCYFVLHYVIFSFILLNFALAFFVDAWLSQIQKAKDAIGTQTRDFQKVARFNQNQIGYSLKTILTPQILVKRFTTKHVLQQLEEWQGGIYDKIDSKFLNLQILRDKVMSDKDNEGHAKGYPDTLDFQPMELYLLGSDYLISSLEKARFAELEGTEGKSNNGDLEMKKVVSTDLIGSDEVHKAELKELQKALQELEWLQEGQLLKFKEAITDLHEKHAGMLDHLDDFKNKLKRLTDVPDFTHKKKTD